MAHRGTESNRSDKQTWHLASCLYMLIVCCRRLALQRVFVHDPLMAYDVELAQRVRKLLKRRKGITERYRTDDRLRSWILLAVVYAKSLPAK